MPPNDVASRPEVKELVTQTDELATIAERYVVKSEADYAAAAAELMRVKGAQKRLEEIRKTITSPLDAAKKAVMDFFRAPSLRLDTAESAIKRQMNAYSDEQDRLRREAQRKLDEQAERDRQRLAARAQRAAATGKADKALELEQQASQVVAPVVAISAPKAAGVSERIVYKFEVTDPNAVPREFLMVDEAKIRRYVGAMRAEARIAGVRIYPDRVLAAGSAA